MPEPLHVTYKPDIILASRLPFGDKNPVTISAPGIRRQTGSNHPFWPLHRTGEGQEPHTTILEPHASPIWRIPQTVASDQPDSGNTNSHLPDSTSDRCKISDDTAHRITMAKKRCVDSYIRLPCNSVRLIINLSISRSFRTNYAGIIHALCVHVKCRSHQSVRHNYWMICFFSIKTP